MRLIAALLLLLPTLAAADCRKSYVCNDRGQNCRYMDVCSSPLDLPSTNLQPLPALPTTELKPLPSLDIPPIGTSSCNYMQVDGEWQNICK
jgi:hypothetical protein